MNKFLKYIIIFIILTFSSISLASEAHRFGPWDDHADNSAQVSVDSVESLSLPAHLLRFAVNGFRETISAVDSDRCPMLPTCSAYSLHAIEKHGFLAGVLMTVDRLLHELDETELAPAVAMDDGEVRFFDPVSANDFWWNKPATLDK
jgi:hypothetical protein